MNKRLAIRTFVGLAMSAAGCTPAKPAPAAAVEPAMVFPMLIVWPGHTVVVWHDASDFKTMHTNILQDAARGDPVLIDGTAQIFDVRKMQSTKSGMWLMANPVAMSSVTLDLSRRSTTGIAAARELLADCKYLSKAGENNDATRAAIAAAADVAALANIAEIGRPTTQPILTFVHGGIVRGDLSSKRLSLVFTGGDYADGVPTILDVCEERKVSAAFFVTGDFLRKHPDAAKSIVDAGYTLGPHSDKHLLYCDWDDRAKTLVTEEQFTSDLKQNLADLKAVGSETRYFLPPFEWYNDDQTRWAEALGLTLVNFSPGSGSNRDYIPESDPKFTSSKKLAEDILGYEQKDPHGLNGFILLLHAGSTRQDKMTDELDSLVHELQRRGYDFVSLDTLLGNAKDTQ